MLHLLHLENKPTNKATFQVRIRMQLKKTASKLLLNSDRCRKYCNKKMARRRKTESKIADKEEVKFLTIRKSNRQRVKKQLDDQKLNGDNSSLKVEPKEYKNDTTKEPVKKINPTSKKLTRCKSLNKEKLTPNAEDNEQEKCSQVNNETCLLESEKFKSSSNSVR